MEEKNNKDKSNKKLEITAERLAEIFIAQIEFKKNKDKNSNEKLK